jgi:hypothetical protein
VPAGSVTGFCSSPLGQVIGDTEGHNSDWVNGAASTDQSVNPHVINIYGLESYGGPPAPTGCTATADCPSGQICQNSACVTPTNTPCGNQCTLDKCNTATNLCSTGCTKNTDCSDGQTCKTGFCIDTCDETHPCEAPGTKCGTGATAGQCVSTGCTKNSDCARGTCENGQCVVKDTVEALFLSI